MILNKMNRTDLDLYLKGLVRKEREILHQILETLQEVDSRRMYLDMGYASLFEYLTLAVGYSNASAQRRIDAARLLREIPDLSEKIQTGKLKLQQISMLQKAVRQVGKSQHKKVSRAEKSELLEAISGQTVQQSQKEIASFFDLPVEQITTQKVQADDSVRIELTLSKEVYEKLQRAQDLISSAVPNRDLVHFVEYVSEKIIQQRASVRPSRVNEKKQQIRKDMSKFQDTSKLKGFSGLKNSKQLLLGADPKTASEPGQVSVPAKTFALPQWKRKAHAKQNCCQYKDPATGKICGSRFFLQVDHKQPRWANGNNTPDNLQILCAGHNALKYRQEAGIRNLSSRDDV